MWNAFVVNLLWIIVGYLIGSINFSIILTSNNPKKKNIKEVGSGNAGATNAARVYGIKFGLLVFILDASKSFWYGFILGILQNNLEPFKSIIPQVCLISVIIGHVFPIYFNFKGGKGAATLLGMIASISLLLAAIGAIIFIAIVWYTRYVSLGSIVVPYILVIISFFCKSWNHFDSVIWYGDFWINPLCLFIGSSIVTASHWKNIANLINKTESKISFKSKARINASEKKLLDTNLEIEANKTIINDQNNIEINSDINENINSIIDDAITKNNFDYE
ncbi:MAG: glycerol-3-phosphate 1-O-acyltransferase PlsY [Mycoplasma sp.]|nr:glycerol-3-phosphate 1-O-acyltransferase PlsY [Mycoplasma sp.]